MPVPAQDGKPVHCFITLVKLEPGKSAVNFMTAIDRVDSKLPGGTRHSRGIHEDLTFVTLGQYDMVVIWRAPDLSTMSNYLQELFDACGSDLGKTETLAALSKGT